MIAAKLPDNTVLFVTSTEPKQAAAYKQEDETGYFTVDPAVFQRFVREGVTASVLDVGKATAFLRSAVADLAPTFGVVSPSEDADGDALVRWLVATLS